MKSNAKSKIIILITLGILFAFSPIITTNLSFIMGNSNNSSDYSDEINLDTKNIKISAVSGKIHIYGKNGWANAKTAGICTGNGTYSDPYVIKDLVIDAGGSGSCILIEYSDVYFRIEKCTVSNAKGAPSRIGAGIRLVDVSNGRLIDNTANNNEDIGIHLYKSNNNIILGNTANNNWGGIHLYKSNNNNISENTANNNEYYGIRLDDSSENIISENLVDNHSTGIYLMDCYSNTISRNIVKNSNHTGIFTYLDTSGNLITLNCLINNRLNGRDDGYNNWDDGIKGNYWDDYTGLDANGDGIGDEPYNITGMVPYSSTPRSDPREDNFPLIKCPISAQEGGGIPIELIILISVISGGAVIGVATLLLIIRKRKRIE